MLGRLWAERDRRPGFVLLSGAVLAFFLAYPFVDWYLRSLSAAGVESFGRVTPFTYNDFSAFTGAVSRWYAGEPIYWRENGGFHGSYLYPPAYVLLFVPFYEAQFLGLEWLPFAEDGFQAGAVLWELASLGLLWVGLQLLAEELGARLSRVERVGLLWLILGFQPALYSFKWAQTAAFQGGLLCLAFVGLSRGRSSSAADSTPAGDADGRSGDADAGAGADGAGTDGTAAGRVGDRSGGRSARLARIASGALTTLAAGMKPFYATSGAHLLRDRDRLAGAMLGGLALVVVSVGLFGPGSLLGYYEVLTWGKGWGAEPIPPQFWGPTYYRPFYAVASRSTDAAIALRLVGLAAIIALSLAARNREATLETFALGVAAIPLFAPTAYTYDYVSLLPAAVVLLAVEVRRGGRPWVPVLAVWLLGVQAYGLKLIVDHLPAWLPANEAIAGAAPVLQPGLWGNLLLLGLAAAGVARTLDRSVLPTGPGTADPDREDPAGAGSD